MKLNSVQGIALLISAVAIIALLFCIRYIIRRQRRMVRDDLEHRGLVPSRKHRRHRHHHRHDNEHEHREERDEDAPAEVKRNPTLAECGGLPPIRTQAPKQPDAK